MCGMCGVLGGGSHHWSTAMAPGEGVHARQQRLQQVAYANRLLAPLRLQLTDFHGQSFVLASPTGAQEIIGDFMQLWKCAERMLGRPIDPLTLFDDEGSKQ